MSILFAHTKRRTVAIDANANNFEDMCRLIDRIADRVDRELRNYVKPVRGFFPAAGRELINRGSIVFVTNASWTVSPELEQEILTALESAGGLIINLRSFFTARDTEEERQELAKRICAHGFAEPQDVYVWKRTEERFQPGHIVFFKNTRFGGVSPSTPRRN